MFKEHSLRERRIDVFMFSVCDFVFLLLFVFQVCKGGGFGDGGMGNGGGLREEGGSKEAYVGVEPCFISFC